MCYVATCISPWVCSLWSVRSRAAGWCPSPHTRITSNPFPRPTLSLLRYDACIPCVLLLRNCSATGGDPPCLGLSDGRNERLGGMAERGAGQGTQQPIWTLAFACLCLPLLAFDCLCLLLLAFACLCLSLLALLAFACLACLCLPLLAFACLCLPLLAFACLCFGCCWQWCWCVWAKARSHVPAVAGEAVVGFVGGGLPIC